MLWAFLIRISLQGSFPPVRNVRPQLRSRLRQPRRMNVGQIIVWIIVGGFAGTLAGRAVTFKKEGLGRWTNFLVGMIGAVIGGELFKLFRINWVRRAEGHFRGSYRRFRRLPASDSPLADG